MIVSFSISNFLSFCSEETISLVASNRLSGSHEDHTISIPGSEEKVLRTAVLYGANGAGKSNLFKALRYAASTAIGPRKKKSGTGRKPFRFAESQDIPSTFDLQFIAGEKLYRFGFKVDDARIREEWLFQVTGGRQKVLYERTTDENGEVAIDSEGLKGTSEKVRALATVGGPPNQSFLATLNANLNKRDIGGDLSAVLRWFRTDLKLVEPEARFRSLSRLLERDTAFLSFAGGFLRLSSTGVDHLKVVKKEISKDELRALLPDPVASTIIQDLAARENSAEVVRLGEDTELLVERKGGEHFYEITIQTAHEHDGKVVPLALSEESDGTRRLLNLTPALYQLQDFGSVFFIDEIDRSLHPMLAREFLAFFLKSCEATRRQIIVTTHESGLLDQDLVRRDEIWFAEKDDSAATRLYSLLDFKVRKDLEIRKHYLQGRFGAVPFLGNIEQLLPHADSQG